LIVFNHSNLTKNQYDDTGTFNYVYIGTLTHEPCLVIFGNKWNGWRQLLESNW